MLPQIFRKDDPVLQITLPPETRSEMEDLLKGLSKPVFEADDSLGWVYRVLGKRTRKTRSTSLRLRSVQTNCRLSHNSSPRTTWSSSCCTTRWAHGGRGKVLSGNLNLATSGCGRGCVARRLGKVGDIDWSYLRSVRDKGQTARTAPGVRLAGAFESWPKSAKDLTVLDPCNGVGTLSSSSLFPILVAFRMAEENLSQSAAIDVALKDNLFGLELDPRCTQIAAFNLAFAAWRKVWSSSAAAAQSRLFRGLALGVNKAEWLRLAEKAVTAADPAAKRDSAGR